MAWLGASGRGRGAGRDVGGKQARCRDGGVLRGSSSFHEPGAIVVADGADLDLAVGATARTIAEKYVGAPQQRRSPERADRARSPAVSRDPFDTAVEATERPSNEPKGIGSTAFDSGDKYDVGYRPAATSSASPETNLRLRPAASLLSR